MLRAAVIGPGRIGRHHAKWYVRSGCELVGYVVSQAASLAARAAELVAECGASPQGFTDTVELLDTARPDLVSVCTPAEAHYAHAKAALERGVSVLCEKPVTWDSDPARALDQADELCELAASHGATLAVNLQYTLAAEPYAALVGSSARPRRCEVTLESRGKGAERTPAEVWMELGPHALSLAFALVPGGVLDASSVTAETAPRTAVARFVLQSPDGPVETSVTTGQRLEGDLVRRFGVNGLLVDYAGRNNEDGVYCTYLSRAGVEREYPDLMRASIERFVAAAAGGGVVVDGRVARANLAAQLQVARGLI